ncbi:MAG: MmcB family DNA repair protein [Beijerinckiaceae bacterium]|nr:MmcB family DNA repair protein [Beijerinckiaceae bacterium]
MMQGLLEPLSPQDARLSGTALLVTRGTRRMLRLLGFSTVIELPLITGRRADIVALAADGTIHIIEVKSCAADFRADVKWQEYRADCDRFYFAIPHEMPARLMPQDAGLIVADAYGAEILRHPPEHRMAASTRRAMLLRFAHAAAQRLHRLGDPEAVTRGS